MIEIINYEPKYQPDFVRLNKQWIEHYFALVPEDLIAFENVNAIIEHGGMILFARVNYQIVGTVAIKSFNDSIGELCKFAVDPIAQGFGVGKALLHAVIENAKAFKFIKLFLEGNTQLVSSIYLYRQFGFKEVENFTSHYQRVNIVMELLL